MFDWLRRRALTTAAASPRIAPRILHDRYPSAGEYERLHAYLRDRYANRVVLTFAEIEDLLGLPLPGLARDDLAWWDGGDFDGAPSTQSLAWTLAGRTATVNLVVQKCRVRARHRTFSSSPSIPNANSRCANTTRTDFASNALENQGSGVGGEGGLVL